MNVEFCFRVLSEIWVAGEILILVFTTTWRGKGKIQDHGSQILLWVVIIASFKVDDWLHRIYPVDMPGAGSWLRPLALGMMVAGLVLRAASVYTLGRAFSANVAVRAGQQLKRDGLYALVRHPSYSGLEMILLACGLHSRTWVCLAVILVPPTLAMLYRIHVEEDALRRAFGAEYDGYSRTRKRLIPGLY